LTFNIVLGALARLYYLQRQAARRRREEAVAEEEIAPSEPAAAFAEG